MTGRVYRRLDRRPAPERARPRGAPVLPIVVVLAALPACGPDEPPPPPPAVDPTDLTFAPELGVDLVAMDRLESGVYLQDQFLGAGRQVRRGSTVQLAYTAWRHDGTRVDGATDNRPWTVALGETRMPAGLSEGLIGMREGGRRKLVIPPALAYGVAGRPPNIPPQATLVYAVEVLDVQ